MAFKPIFLPSLHILAQLLFFGLANIYFPFLNNIRSLLPFLNFFHSLQQDLMQCCHQLQHLSNNSFFTRIPLQRNKCNTFSLLLAFHHGFLLVRIEWKENIWCCHAPYSDIQTTPKANACSNHVYMLSHGSKNG